MSNRTARLLTAVLILAPLGPVRAQEGGMPPIQVGVVTAAPEAIPVVSTLPGRISATAIAEVRPRVGGIIISREFEQGVDVKAGDPLFQIDPATFAVQVEAAQAGVASAEAALLRATQTANRSRTLAGNRTLSTADLETAVASEKEAQAGVAAAEAQLHAAEINLDYATVRAPISGRIGRALVTQGTLVGAADPQPMATIQQLDPVYADIQQPVGDLLKLKQALRDGALTQAEPESAPVTLKLDNGSDYPHPGRLLFSEAAVEPTSGQVTLRAEFPNPEGTLLPGLYVRVAVEQGVNENAIAVPDQAIQRDAAGNASVMVIGANNIPQPRPVGLGQLTGGRTVVTSGLQPGDQVIVDGFQKMGMAPGAPVQPVPWTDPTSAPAPASPAGTGGPAPAGAAEPSAPAATGDAPTGGTAPPSSDATPPSSDATPASGAPAPAPTPAASE